VKLLDALRAALRRLGAVEVDPPDAAAAPDPVDDAFERAANIVRLARGEVVKHVVFGELGGTDLDTWFGKLRYSRDDPYAVHAQFGTNDGKPVIWVFARDLLHTAAVDRQPAGLGDVQLYERDSNTLVFALSSPDGSLAITVDQADIAAFLRESYAIVPRGKESEHLGLDAERLESFCQEEWL
jgi:hypothetical protein